MNRLNSNGLSPQAGAQRRSANPLSNNFRRLSSSASSRANDCAVVSLDSYKAQRRRAAAAAQAHARRRAVIGLALALLGLLAGVAVQEREAQLQRMEVWK